MAPFRGFFPLCSICKSTARHGEEFYLGLQGGHLRGDCSVSSCPGWNAGAWLHIPHRGSTPDTHKILSVVQQTDRRCNSGTRLLFCPNTKGNSLQWTAKLHNVAIAQTHTSLFICGSCRTCSAIHGERQMKVKAWIVWLKVTKNDLMCIK